MRLMQDKKIVPLLRSADINAGVDSDSVDMTDASHAAFLLSFGACTGAAGPILKLYEGATHGAKTTALTFNYRYGGAAAKSASADVYSAEATSAALQIATATLQNRLLVIELAASAMTDGMRYLTIEVGAEADSGVLHIEAILEPAYKGDVIASVID
jgi:hypothetical protein